MTRPAEDAAWMEEDLFERASERFSQPIAHFVVDERDHAIVDSDRDESWGERPSSEAEVQGRSQNMPPFSVRDLLSVGIAVIGTVVLIVLASSCSGFSAEGGLSTSGLSGCAARALIAGAIALANLAHIVGLVLFQTVRYRGFWRNFLARLSLYGTLAGLAGALLVET